MSISKADKGFTLIEVMVSLGIFAMLFSGALAVMLSQTSLAAWNRSTRDNLAFAEAVAGVMADGMTYSEVLELRDTGRIYIRGEDMEMDFIKERGAYGLFTRTEPAAGSRISLHITEGPVLEVEVRLHQIIRGKADVYSSRFWKGSYKR
jgi:prepilin-type N-terminal cleavage/methylation domain-containing protein